MLNICKAAKTSKTLADNIKHLPRTPNSMSLEFIAMITKSGVMHGFRRDEALVLTRTRLSHREAQLPDWSINIPPLNTAFRLVLHPGFLISVRKIIETPPQLSICYLTRGT